MNVRKRKAISPLIATLLLIAIAVAASVLTYSWVMSMVGSQSGQAQTQLRIDSVTWAAGGDFSILIRNTGSVAATIESVGIRTNIGGSTFSIWKPVLPVSIEVGLTKDQAIDTGIMIPSFTGLAPSTPYVIRVTATTGFYYELVATTPVTLPT
jgi:flagellin-like protein